MVGPLPYDLDSGFGVLKAMRPGQSLDGSWLNWVPVYGGDLASIQRLDDHV